MFQLQMKYIRLLYQFQSYFLLKYFIKISDKLSSSAKYISTNRYRL